jgi:hypothetical protein
MVSATMPRFLAASSFWRGRLDLGRESVPVEVTVCRFQNGVPAGPIVDAAITTAPFSAKNVDKISCQAAIAEIRIGAREFHGVSMSPRTITRTSTSISARARSFAPIV